MHYFDIFAIPNMIIPCKKNLLSLQIHVTALINQFVLFIKRHPSLKGCRVSLAIMFLRLELHDKNKY